MTTFTKQCQYCAFKLSEDQSTDAKALFIEDKYRAIRGVKDAPTNHVIYLLAAMTPGQKHAS